MFSIKNNVLCILIIPEHSTSIFDVVRFDTELSALFCKLTQDGAATNELSPKRHHWSTIVYVGFVMFKVGDDIAIL